ncbi:MAG: hypothetical protein AAGD34_07625 [Pseudomonadota bacterium]
MIEALAILAFANTGLSWLNAVSVGLLRANAGSAPRRSDHQGS